MCHVREESGLFWICRKELLTLIQTIVKRNIDDFFFYIHDVAQDVFEKILC